MRMWGYTRLRMTPHRRGGSWGTYPPVSGAKALIHRGNTRDRWKLLGRKEMCEGYKRTRTALATKSNDAI